MPSVYFIQAGDECGPVKIGIAKRPMDRLAELQTGCPLPLQMRFLFVAGDDASLLETALHEVFASARLQGREWFTWSPRIDAVIEQLRRFQLDLIEAHGDFRPIKIMRGGDCVSAFSFRDSSIAIEIPYDIPAWRERRSLSRQGPVSRTPLGAVEEHW